MRGLEALLRWRHPERGMISPAVFVPLAERFGLIGAIGHWVIDEACAQLARWHAQGLHCRVAINLSPYQLRHPDLPARLRNALERSNLHPSQLVCEITETAMMENRHAERSVLDQIAALGVRLSIDDFGTGYAGLAHLRSIPARQIKIDRSFVVDLAADADAQRAALVALGCDLLQGYVVARPMPAGDVPQWFDAAQAGQTAPAPPGRCRYVRP